MKKLLVLITIAVLFLAFSQQKTHAATCDTITWNTPIEKATNSFTLSGTIANCSGQRRVRIKIQYQRVDSSDQPISLMTDPITVTDGKLITDVPFTYPVTVSLTLYDIDNTDSVIVNPNCNTVPANLKNNSRCNWVYYTTITPGGQIPPTPGTSTTPKPSIACNTSFSYTGDQSLLVCPKDCPTLIPLQGTNYQCSTQNLTNLALETADVRLFLRPKSEIKDTYIVNQAYATYIGSTGSNGGGNGDSKIFNSSSKSLNDMYATSANTYKLPVALLKAIAHLESGGVAPTYTEAEVATYSQNNWWAGKTSEADTLSGNDPIVLRGFGYNTCKYKAVCGPGNDVRGMMQFLEDTWNGVKTHLSFADGHVPDRRINRDVILGAGYFIRDMTKGYPEFGFPADEHGWTDAQIRAVGLYYCTGNPRGNGSDAACGTPGNGYDDVLSLLFKKYSQ